MSNQNYNFSGKHGKMRANIGQMLGKYAVLRGNMRVYTFSLCLSLSYAQRREAGSLRSRWRNEREERRKGGEWW